ncbi:hypothetical protein GGI25_003513 [Coemansia spiralis]|uniref:GH18 domain-containing protein n=2 Tax=Coemansia TaxID=4863 RepID=A0A9W8G8C8_9FUNG|nr:hypothetical protein EDC05_006410 [Coemansia umbellata]KAJ2622109.1 hypothetical protein GGI26_003551 [Coemansia sp. RSA 1358]KAJ2676478.1 hypothetical protein GGI25_003513 [Coemansia spiralis]
MRFSLASVGAMLAFGATRYALAAESRVIGYYASWKQQQSVGIDFSKYTHINLSFGVPAKDGSISFDKTLSLPDIIGQIHGNKTKVLVSLGGWSDSTYFTSLVSDTTATNPFITNIVKFVETNNLDGIDIDWEYPGGAGNGCNNPDLAKDTPNYLKFLQNLRAAFTSKFGAGKKLITMAVYLQPFVVNGTPITDVSEFAKVVDYANLMQYDINGAWNNVTGPNAPLNFQNGEATQLSFTTAIDAWTGAGWPASQLNAGLAFYGRSTTALEDMTQDPKNQYQAQEKGVIPPGDKEDGLWADPCTSVKSYSGIWQWKHLRDQGVLTNPTTAGSTWVRQWDPVSQTPWLFNPSTKRFISYEDPTSIAAKVKYALEKGLGGTMVWAVYMDYNNELLDTVLTTIQGGDSDSGSSQDPSDSSIDNYSAAHVDDYSASPFDDYSAVDHIEYNYDGSSNHKDGAPCSNEYDYVCGSNGRSPDYYLCLHGLWTKLSCGIGTVCQQQSNAISCGWASTS